MASGVPVVLAVVAMVTSACSGHGPGPSPAAGKPLHAPANFDPTLPGWVACSRLIVEGDVVGVRDAASQGRMVTELAVQDWVKPAAGPRTTRIETVDIAAEGVYRRWPAGTHLFLQVGVDPGMLPSWEFDAATITKIKRAVPASRTIACPYGPS